MKTRKKLLTSALLCLAFVAASHHGYAATIEFQRPVTYPVGTNPRTVTVALDVDPYYVVAGDFNNDHKPDLALSGLGRDLDGEGIRDSAGGTTVLLGNGDGTFQNRGPLLPLSLSLAADFNQDGRLDLA